MVAVLSVATVISLIPSWPDQMTDVSTADPPFFTSSVVDQIPYDGVVLTYPFAVSPDNQAMLWQEDDRYRFTILGGYALEPQPNGSVSPWPPELAPLDVQEFLGWEEFAPSQGYLLPAAPPVTGQLIRDFRVYAKRYAVGTVLFDPVGDDPRIVLDVLTRAFGPPSATEGGLDLWFHVDTELAARVG
jgi:hypothetical protein